MTERATIAKGATEFWNTETGIFLRFSEIVDFKMIYK